MSKNSSLVDECLKLVVRSPVYKCLKVVCRNGAAGTRRR